MGRGRIGPVGGLLLLGLGVGSVAFAEPAEPPLAEPSTEVPLAPGVVVVVSPTDVTRAQTPDVAPTTAVTVVEPVPVEPAPLPDPCADVDELRATAAAMTATIGQLCAPTLELHLRPLVQRMREEAIAVQALIDGLPCGEDR
jgi:hypothetical protein